MRALASALARVVVVGAVLGVGLGSAQAGKRVKTLVIVDWRGAWTPAEKQKLADALAIGFDSAGLDRVEDQVSGFVLDPRFAGCIGRESCSYEYARATGATYVFAVIPVKQGKSSRVVMTLHNIPLLAETAVEVRRGKSVAQASAAARRMIVELVEKERKTPRGILEIVSTPSSAGDAVFIDGHATGVTPVTITLYAGAHLVRIERKGSQPHIAQVNVFADKTAHYEARFEKAVVPAGDGK
jgi:hypothetical protein